MLPIQIPNHASIVKMLGATSLRSTLAPLAPLSAPAPAPAPLTTPISAPLAFASSPAPSAPLSAAGDVAAAPIFLPDPREGLPAPPHAEEIERLLAEAVTRPGGLLNEHEVYKILESAGMDIPEHHFVAKDAAAKAGASLDPKKKYVIKAVITGCAHKTDIGAVGFNVTKDTAAAKTAEFAAKFKDMPFEGVLFCEQLDFSKGGFGGGEWILSSYCDDFFGPTLCFGVGGTAVEYAQDVFKEGQAQAFIPAHIDIEHDTVIRRMLHELPATQILTGQVRGNKKQIEEEQIVKALSAIQRIMRYYSDNNVAAKHVVREIEVNPLVTANGRLYALDGVLRVEENPNYGKNPLEVTPLYSTNKPIEQIGAILRPTSACVVGASNRATENPSSTILEKLKNKAVGLSKDAIFAMHPRENSVRGVPAFPTMAEVKAANGGKPVDLLVIGVPAAAAGAIVKEAMDQQAAKGILMIPGGFAETEGGKVLQERIEADISAVDAANANASAGGVRRLRPVINGPNTLGDIATDGADTVFTPAHKSGYTGKGCNKAALIAQSGAFLIARWSDMAGRVAPQIAASVGNQMDLSATDFLEYLLHHDEQAKKDVNVIGIYTEGFKAGEGLRMQKLIGDAQRMGKQVVIYKAGRSKEGQEAAKGHTASMAGDYKLIKGFLESAGAIMVEDSREFENVMLLCSLWGAKPFAKLAANVGKNRPFHVAAVTNAGTDKCQIGDQVFKGEPHEVGLVPFGQVTKEKIGQIYGKYKLGSVVDVCDILDVTPMLPQSSQGDGWYELCSAVIKAPEVDVTLITLTPEANTLDTLSAEHALRVGAPEAFEHDKSFLSCIRRLRDENPESVFIVSVEAGALYDDLRDAIVEAGIPCYRSADEASAAVRKALTAIRKA